MKNLIHACILVGLTATFTLIGTATRASEHQDTVKQPCLCLSCEMSRGDDTPHRCQCGCCDAPQIPSIPVPPDPAPVPDPDAVPVTDPNVYPFPELPSHWLSPQPWILIEDGATDGTTGWPEPGDGDGPTGSGDIYPRARE